MSGFARAGVRQHVGMGEDRRRTDPDDRSHAMSLRAGFSLSELSIGRLWVAVLGIGGELAEPELADILEGRRAPTSFEHDLIAQALNDYFTERGQNHPVPYARELAQQDEPSDG